MHLNKQKPKIFETIVTTVDLDGHAHLAPFGVREQDDLILISPFRPSASLDNFLLTKTAVINLTDDVRVFAGALTGRRDWSLSKAIKVNGVFLDSALCHRELSLVDLKDNEIRPEFLFKVVHEEIHSAFKGFNRAQAAVIELSVLVSRLNILPIEKIETEMDYLKIAIEKTAGEREYEAWTWLVEKIQNHKAEISGENQA